MTLCLAWKNGDRIRFASDSRISFDDDQYSDVGIKVMEVSVKIDNPIPYETGIVTTAYNYKLGMCFAGSTTNAYLIKETINDVLQRLQFTPFCEDFSLRGICRVIEKFVASTSGALRDGLGMDPNIEFLIGGFCPENQRVMVYKFELIDCHDHYEIMVDEVLDDEDDYISLGSGTTRAEEIILERGIASENTLFKVLREVCQDEDIPDVGGLLQYGHFENDGNFKVFGVADYRIKEDDLLEYIYVYRGTLLYREEFEIDERNLHIAQKFIMPFEDEIKEYWKQQGLDS